MLRKLEITYQDFLEEPKRKYITAFDSGEDVCLDYRENNEKTRLIIKNFPWYFCIRKEDATKNKTLLKKFLDLGKIKKFEADGDFIKIYTRNTNKNVMDEKHEIGIELDERKIQHYEWDLSSSKRLLIDHELKIETNYRILYFDIETDDRGKGIVIGRDRIISIAAINQEGKVYYYSYNDERKTLKRFLDRLEDYDMLVGWNSEKFDIPYIRERLKYLGIYYNWKQILQVDLMQKTMELNKKNVEMIKEVRGFSLEAVARHVLKEGKKELSMGTYAMFILSPEKLREYNIKDVELLVKLDNKLNLVKQKVIEHTITGSFLDEYFVSKILDIYILRNAKKFGNVRFKSKPARDLVNFDPNREANYAGGYVIDPIKGIHKNVYHFDFTSLYPSIIQTFNISPETLLEKEQMDYDDAIKTPNEQHYRYRTGIIPSIITDLLKARNDIRYNQLKNFKEGTQEYENLYYKQYAFKTLANSFYGILGAPFTRYYKRENAEAITLTGHYLIKLMKSWFENKGYTVIYGDTDSIFITTEEKIDLETLHNKINTFLAYHLHRFFNVEDSRIDLKVEATYKKMLLVMKKKYVKVKDEKLVIMGMEAKRRETLPLAARLQIDLFKMLLLEESTIEQTINWLEKQKEYVCSKMTKEDLVCQIKLSKDVELYDKKVKNEFGETLSVKESKLPHVQVAKWLRENGIKEEGRNSWDKGCYIKYIVVEHKPKIKATSVYNFNQEYDKIWYWNTKVYAILQRILEVVYPENDWESFLLEEPKILRKKQTNQMTLC